MQHEFAVLGFGPAGATVATLLARAGRDVVVVDEVAEPRVEVGESLLPWCAPVLARLGVDMGGFIVKRGAVFTRGGLAWRVDFSDTLHAEHPTAWEVRRDVFDARLRAVAIDAGARFVQARVEAITPPRAVTSAGIIEADRIIDALGRKKVLAHARGLVERHPVLKNAATGAHFTGVTLLGPAVDGDITICAFPERAAPQGWFWFIPIAPGRTSVGLVTVPGAHLGGDRWEGALARCPDAAARLAGATRLTPFRGYQDFTSYASRFSGPGWALAGDAALFLDPVFSSGVLLCLESAAGLADALVGGDLDGWERDLRSAVEPIRDAILSFYDGSFLDLALCRPDQQVPRIRRAITSLLAGDVFGPDTARVHRVAAQIGAFAERVRGST